MAISGASVPIKSGGVVLRRIDAEIVFMQTAGDASELRTLCTANDVGARVWELTDGDHSVEDIASVIASEYDVDEGTARADTEAFLQQLTQARCVDWLDEPRG